ncbi:MAG: hypothetical protein L0I93_03590, partial [Atopostipes suicloacalis]|nr:hypothetical protein [Atopostipes suicloacalis]
MFQFFINEDKIENYHFSVLDDSRKIQYLIVGYWGKKGDKIDLMSPKGTLLLQAKQGNFSPFFQFDLIHQHKKIGSIQKHPGFFGLRDAFFTIQPENWVVRGNFE